MAVVAAGEFDDFVALRIGAGDADRRHDGFRAGVDEADLVHRRDRFFQHFGKPDFQLGRRAVKRPVRRRLLNGPRHMRMGVSGNDRPVGGQIIDVAVAVHVPKIRAFGFFHKNGRPAAHRFKRPGGAVDAADDMFERFLI